MANRGRIMDNIFFPVARCAALFAIVTIVVIGTFVYRQRVANRRQKELFAWAMSKGLSFTRRSCYGLDDLYPQFTCLRQSSVSDIYGYNVIEGKWNGRSLIAFDYHCSPGVDKDDHKNDFSVVIIKSGVLLKPLLIRPANVFDIVKELAGFSDIEFESAQFNRCFRVKSPDKRWAYDVIHPRMMEFLMAAPKFTIQFDLTRIMACRNQTPDHSGDLFSVQDFEAAIGVVEGMLERFPCYVITQQKEDLNSKNKGV
jgi:hypothetical protein